MKIAMALVLLLCVSALVSARHITHPHSHHNHGHHHNTNSRAANAVKADMYGEPKAIKYVRPDTVQVAGSRLPDCSHACGSCRPCRLVMVSFVCSSLEEAETCPMAYKCMCKRKSYPVP